MRFKKLWIDGYGRFAYRSLELTPGLQIVLGPNEHGKTTIRSFIADMLYGQRRNAHAGEFDAGHELRRPWNSPERYAGRMSYELDDGCEIEVQRTFDGDPLAGGIHVFDRTHGSEITGEFPRLQNHEPSFAEKHLGLTKAVFVNTATVGHLSLEHLGDADALDDIRERILGLADSSEESGTADAALRRLTERIASIGRPAVDAGKPLSQARGRREALELERDEAEKMRNGVSRLEMERAAVRAELAILHERRTSCEAELSAIESRERLQRFIEAQRIQLRIDEVTQKCFALSSVREFPLDHMPEVQRAANAVATARAQTERTRDEQADLERQLNEETGRLGAGADAPAYDVPEQTERELADLEGRIVRLTERLEALQEEQTRAEQRIAQAQHDLEILPNFNTIDTDPVEWLSQLAMSFRLASQSALHESEKLQRLRESIEKQQSELTKPFWVFSRFDDFLAEARDYDVQVRMHSEHMTTLNGQLEQTRALANKRDIATPGFLWGTAILTLFSAGFIAAALLLKFTWLFIPGGLCLVTLIFSATMWISGRLTARGAYMELLEIQDELLRLEEENEERREKIDKAMIEAGVGTLRELEAMYEHYTHGSAALKALKDTLAQQEAMAREEDERVSGMLTKIRQTFAEFGETVADAEDVPKAVNRSLARYQEYRDAKRRLAENRERPAQLGAQCDRVRWELEDLRRDEVNRAVSVRQTMREAGFREESRFTSALGAVRTFRVRNADLRQKRGRIEVLQERRIALENRLESEGKDLAKYEEALTRKLSVGGAQTIEQWHEFAKRAKQYRDAWEERSRLMEKLDTLLHGDTIEALRKAVERDTAGIEMFRRPLSAVKEEMNAVRESIEECKTREHALQLQLVKLDSGYRSISEIEEDLAVIDAQIDRFEFELKAASYAASVIEEVARDKHARIAPRMAALAGKYLGEITTGAYSELFIGRDLSIQVRVPQTGKLTEETRAVLSKGTVDQIYLAMRLALVRSLSETGETIPLLLDDPFANYDDKRLTNALTLLERIGESNQVILFTCRQDVATVAEAHGVPIERL